MGKCEKEVLLQVKSIYWVTVSLGNKETNAIAIVLAASEISAVALVMWNAELCRATCLISGNTKHQSTTGYMFPGTSAFIAANVNSIQP